MIGDQAERMIGAPCNRRIDIDVAEAGASARCRDHDIVVGECVLNIAVIDKGRCRAGSWIEGVGRRTAVRRVVGCGAGRDRHIGWIEQQGPVGALGRRGIGRSRVRQVQLAGNLDKAAVARRRPAARRNRAGIAGRLIGPDDDITALALGAGIRRNRCTRRDVRRFCVGDRGFGQSDRGVGTAMAVATDQHGAAIGRAIGRNLGSCADIHRRGGRDDRAARTIGVGCRHRAVDADAVAARQINMAVLGRRAGGADNTAVICRQRIDIAADGVELRLGRVDRAAVGDIAATGIHQHRIVAAGLKQDIIAGRQGRGPLGGIDAAAIGNRLADQDHIASRGRDRSLVDDRARRRTGQRHGATGHEGGVGHVPAGGDEAAAGCDLAARQHDDTGRVDDIDRARRRQRSRDRRQIAAGHAIQRCPGTVGDIDRLPRGDRKALPVDDTVGRGLADGQPIGS